MKQWMLRLTVRVPVCKNVYRNVKHEKIVDAENREQARGLADKVYPGYSEHNSTFLGKNAKLVVSAVGESID